MGREHGARVVAISAADGLNLESSGEALRWGGTEGPRRPSLRAPQSFVVYRPAVEDRVVVAREDRAYRVHSERVERVVAQTPLDNRARCAGCSDGCARSASRRRFVVRARMKATKSASVKPRSNGYPKMRDKLRDAKRIVVKVGTTTLTRANGRLDPSRIDRLVGELCSLLDANNEIVCVTSGAIAAGLGPLGLEQRPHDMPTLQAAAAVGQSHLMDAYASAFEAVVASADRCS